MSEIRSSGSALRAHLEPDSAAGAVLDLRYVARAGLIPELSGQTYDALWKALREAVLNSVDACAGNVHISFQDGSDGPEILIEDDGVGMSLVDLADHFVSVGGSARFGDDEKFGRIGIGSLALLQYGSRMLVETKRADSAHYVVAHLTRPAAMDQSARRRHLDRLEAGTAEEIRYRGPASDSFTRIRLVGLRDEAAAVASDPTEFFRLVETLRRVLPLPWPENRLVTALATANRDVSEEIAAHCRRWSATVSASSEWSDRVTLTRRHFGERDGLGEDWAGPVYLIAHTLSVADEGQRRQVRVLGFLLNQTCVNIVVGSHSAGSECCCRGAYILRR
jgi:hypothetical protein